MKPAWITIFLITLSCNKTETAGKAIYGNWKWIKTYWSIGPGPVYSANPDSIVYLSFSPQGSYSFKVNDKIRQQGSFTIQSINSDQVLVLDSSLNAGQLHLDLKITYSISGDTLSLADFYTNPGGTSKYVFKRQPQ